MKLLPPIIAALLLSGSAIAQKLEVVPARVMTDESVAIRASGLAPNEHVTIRSEITDGAGEGWAAQAEFVADGQGAVDASKQAPVSGSYKEISAMGLIWAALPVSKKVNSFTQIRNLGPQSVELHLLRQGKEAASAHLEQIGMADGVKRIEVHDGSLRGSLFVPSDVGQHPGRHPAVLVVGGSEGGVPTRRAAWLASHGYAALALAYFRFEDLPPQLERIPLEYFQRAMQWMASRPEIGDAPIGVVGASRGGELALQLGAMFPHVAAVVAYVPSSVRISSCCQGDGQPAWTWQGRALAYVTPRQKTLAAARMEATIPVENTKGSILMISGEADHVWNSAEMADDVLSRLKSHRFAFGAQNLKYPRAGHYAGRVEFIPTWHREVVNPTSGRETDPGGSPDGDAHSTIDSMPKVLEFLKKNLPEPK
jgi:dienelactone hydrolase